MYNKHIRTGKSKGFENYPNILPISLPEMPSGTKNLHVHHDLFKFFLDIEDKNFGKGNVYEETDDFSDGSSAVLMRGGLLEGNDTKR